MSIIFESHWLDAESGEWHDACGFPSNWQRTEMSGLYF